MSTNESKVNEIINELIDEMIAKLGKAKIELQKQLDELKKLETEAAPEEVWPKDGDKYWCIDFNSNCLHWDGWLDDEIDKRRAEIGNVFRTEEEAKAALQRLKDLATVRADAKGFVPDWSDKHQAKYGIYYDQLIPKDFALYTTWSVQHNVLYFRTKEDAWNSIRQHKAEWLRLLGVTEK